MLRRSSFTSLLVVCLLLVAGLPALAASADQRIDLRVLVVVPDADDLLTTEPAAAAWIDHMERVGAAYEVADLSSVDLVATGSSGGGRLALAADDTHAYYQGVVATTSALASLPAAQSDALAWLQETFGVRQAVPYAWPQPAFGLTAENVTGGADIADGSVTTAGRSVFGMLDGPVPVDAWNWGYPGATPLTGFTTLVSYADGSPLLGVYETGGRETMVSTLNANPWMEHVAVLQSGMLRWLTRGVHLGHDRDYLSLQIDDVFLADDRWDSDANSTPEPSDNPIRMTAADVARATAWQRESGLVLDMVYNGFGVEEHGTDGLFDALIDNRDEFRWVNHTYTHLNLDYGEQGGNFVVAEDTIVDEIQRNIDFARTHDLPIDAGELVTGQHSGVGTTAPPVDANPNMAEALTRTGIDWVASDNSREVGQRGLGSALTVPRHPANIYYNVGTFEEQLDEYNHIYFDGCESSPTHTCLPAPATWDQYVDSEATIMLSHVLGNDPRPHYMHQSNLAEDGTLYPIVDEVLDRYRQLFTTTIEQPTLTEAGVLLRDQAAHDTALGAGSVRAWLENGVVTIQANGRVPVTGTTHGTEHGGARSGWLAVSGSAQLTAAGYDAPDGATPDPTDPTPVDPNPTDPTPTDPDPDNPPAQPELGLSLRLGGANRIETAVKTSENAYDPGQADAAVLARADDFADALAGTPLAHAERGPLLLTETADLNPLTAAELQRALPDDATVYLLGGTTALSEEVAGDVRDLGFTVERIGGAHRYDTAVKIATDGLGSPSTVLLATGRNFADALSAGAAAAKVGGAVLLTNDEDVPAEVSSYLDGRAGATVFAVGGPAARAEPSATPFNGSNRYATSRAVAEEFFAGASTVGLASGSNFPDALSGGAHIASRGGAMLLSRPAALDAEAAAYLEANRSTLQQVYVYGGTSALRDVVEEGALAAIR